MGIAAISWAKAAKRFSSLLRIKRLNMNTPDSGTIIDFYYLLQMLPHFFYSVCKHYRITQSIEPLTKSLYRNPAIILLLFHQFVLTSITSTSTRQVFFISSSVKVGCTRNIRLVSPSSRATGKR